MTESRMPFEAFLDLDPFIKVRFSRLGHLAGFQTQVGRDGKSELHLSTYIPLQKNSDVFS